MIASEETTIIWDAEHGMRAFDVVLASDYQTRLTGWKRTWATAISNDAHTIAGYGTSPDGRTDAWIVTLPN